MAADQIICPWCNKKSYTAATHAYLPCPHCNQTFSARGAEKRRYPRITREVSFSLMVGSQTVSAKTIDISKGGLGIKLMGTPHVPAGEIIEISIPEIDVNAKAKVVWWKSHHRDIGSETRMGVMFV